MRLFGRMLRDLPVGSRLVSIGDDYDIATAYVAWSKADDFATTVVAIKDFKAPGSIFTLAIEKYTVTNELSDAAINELASRTKADFNALINSIYGLGTYPISAWVVRSLDVKINELMPKRVNFINTVRMTAARYGMNALALLQAFAYRVWVMSRTDVDMESTLILNHHANELLTNPGSYLRKYANA